MITEYNEGIGRPIPDGLNLIYDGKTFLPGLYRCTVPFTLTNTISFDAQNDTSDVWIMQITSKRSW